MPTEQQDALKGATAKQGFTAHLSPTDAESASPCGGVGVLVRRPIGSFLCQPKTEEYARAFKLGRLILTVVSISDSFAVMVASVYGWASAVKR